MSDPFDGQIRKAATKNKSIVLKLVQRLVNIGLVADDAVLVTSLNILERSLFYCPIDTGRLRASAFLKRTKKKTAVGGVAGGLSAAGTTKYSIGYSPASQAGDFIIRAESKAFYAVFVHEMSKNHKSPTSWKFLERAFNEKKDSFIPAIRDAIKTKAFVRPGRSKGSRRVNSKGQSKTSSGSTVARKR